MGIQGTADTPNKSGGVRTGKTKGRSRNRNRMSKTISKVSSANRQGSSGLPPHQKAIIWTMGLLGTTYMTAAKSIGLSNDVTQEYDTRPPSSTTTSPGNTTTVQSPAHDSSGGLNVEALAGGLGTLAGVVTLSAVGGYLAYRYPNSRPVKFLKGLCCKPAKKKPSIVPKNSTNKPTGNKNNQSSRGSTYEVGNEKTRKTKTHRTDDRRPETTEFREPDRLSDGSTYYTDFSDDNTKTTAPPRRTKKRKSRNENTNNERRTNRRDSIDSRGTSITDVTVLPGYRGSFQLGRTNLSYLNDSETDTTLTQSSDDNNHVHSAGRTRRKSTKKSNRNFDHHGRSQNHGSRNDDLQSVSSGVPMTDVPPPGEIKSTKNTPSHKKRQAPPRPEKGPAGVRGTAPSEAGTHITVQNTRYARPNRLEDMGNF